jgi:hypothetical protein
MRWYVPLSRLPVDPNVSFCRQLYSQFIAGTHHTTKLEVAVAHLPPDALGELA